MMSKRVERGSCMIWLVVDGKGDAEMRGNGEGWEEIRDNNIT